MEGSKTISLEIGGNGKDALRFGLQGVKGEIVGDHPLQSAQESMRITKVKMKRKILSTTYGTASPLKMDLDRQILSRFQRPQGAVPSSMLGLEALTGSLDDFTFEDYLDDPRDRNSPPCRHAS